MNKFEAYNIAGNTWATLAPLPPTMTYNDRNHLAATAVGGKVYVAGGRYNGGGFGSPRTASLDIFDPATGMWTRGMDMPRVRGGVNGVAANGCFFVWGGEGQGIGEPNDVYPDHDVYNPRTEHLDAAPAAADAHPRRHRRGGSSAASSSCPAAASPPAAPAAATSSRSIGPP